MNLYEVTFTCCAFGIWTTETKVMSEEKLISLENSPVHAIEKAERINEESQAE